MKNLWWLVVLSLFFSAAVYGASPLDKPIPADQVIPTLETSLQELAQQPPMQAQAFAASLGMNWQQGRVRVVVETSGAAPATAIASMGGEVVSRADYLHLLEVEVPVSQLDNLARLPGVRFVRRPYRPVPTSISEGVTVTGANAWHTAGIRGQGIKVAVIDGGFQGLSAAVASGAVGNVVYTHDYTGDGLETGGVHGTACAEIVHEMAPGAQLLVMKIGTGVDLAQAVNDAIAQGANVITHSMGWFNTNFYDGTGPIAAIAAKATSHGILWVNSAGNSADGGHWEGNWSDPDSDGWLNFAPTDEVNTFHLKAGERVVLYLTWNAWPTTNQDYDLYVVNSAGKIVAASEDYQTGTQPPVEAISYTARIAGNYGVAIYARNAPSHPRLDLFAIPYNLPLEYPVAASSITAPGNASFVFTVGAIDWQDWTTGPQEAFSSQGPTNASRYAQSIIKPDVCGPDGTSSSPYNGKFYGTSASAPHVAGAAALVWSAHRSWGESAVRQYLENNAVDMGPVGKDNFFGYGRINLPAPQVSPGPSGTTHTYGAAAGWYMVSVPTTGNAASLFGTTLYTYSPSAGRYVTATSIVPSTGYWAYLPGSKAITVTSTQVTSDVTIGLPVAGWYQISAPWSYPKSAIEVTKGGVTKSWADAVSAGWVRDQIYGYTATGGAYTTPTTMDPWYGYWMLAKVSGLTLTLKASSGTPVSASSIAPMSAPTTVAPLGLPPLPTGAVSVTNVRVLPMPNPVTQDEIVTFWVKGICPCLVDGLRVNVYDLAGNPVWSGSGSDAVVYWDTHGAGLANGVYLYRAEVNIGGDWKHMLVGKVTILR